MNRVKEGTEIRSYMVEGKTRSQWSYYFWGHGVGKRESQFLFLLAYTTPSFQVVHDGLD